MTVAVWPPSPYRITFATDDRQQTTDSSAPWLCQKKLSILLASRYYERLTVFKQSAAGAFKAHGFLGHFSFHICHCTFDIGKLYLLQRISQMNKCKMRNVNYNGHPLL